MEKLNTKHKRECRQSNEEKYDISGQALEGFLLGTTRAKGNNCSIGLGPGAN